MTTLYRKYRPKNFSEVIGQKHIVQTLSNAVKNDRVGQAYLFTGPRGTGKTSIARILAKTINCAALASEERADAKSSIRRSDAKADTGLCNACGICPACRLIDEGRSLDIIEIDAASNTGVDNIRELRETISMPPTSLKFKVYIIDEVHMLSSGAFNALLKTLEEPPAHVVFILATTEIHKVPDTIISRCQRFDFSRLPMNSIVEKLSLIATQEKIKIDKEALEMIALSAEGGMRDAESLLGQVIALEDKNITLKEVEEIIGATDRKSAAEVAAAILESDSSSAIEKINSLLEDGRDLAVFNKSLVNYLRQLMLLKINPELKSHFSYEITSEQIKKMLSQAEKAELPKIILAISLLLEAQNKIGSSVLPQLPLEIAVIRATGTFPAPQEVNVKLQESSKNTQPLSKKEIEKKENNHTEEETPEPKNAPSIADDGSEISVSDVKSKWSKLLTDIRPYNHSLSVLLSSCQPREVSGRKITIATPYDFYKDKLTDMSNKLTVEQVLGNILGAKIIIEAVVDKDILPKKESPEDAISAGGTQDPLLASALEILGGKVVEE